MARIASPILLILVALRSVPACSSGEDTATPAERPQHLYQTIPVRGDPALVENSAAVTSVIQPGVIFGANDSGHEPRFFALDTLGSDRGSWLVTNARNRDWEAMASGPCDPARRSQAATGDTPTTSHPGHDCLYIADVGDNGSERAYVTLYRVQEPVALNPGGRDSVRAERLNLRYPGLRPDVEAMFVSGNGDTFLITKRPLRSASGAARPALVFRVPRTTWRTNATVLAELVDSLPIVPGSTAGRHITDAAVSHDGRWLAVRTYAEVFVLAVDSLSGRLIDGAPWWSCPVDALRERQGEGVAWLGTRILLTSEGRDAPLHVITCPPPPS